MMVDSQNINLSVDISVANLSLRSDGIIYVVLKDDSDIKIPDIIEIQNHLADFVKEGNIFLLVNACCHSTSSDEARKYAASTALAKRFKAEAIVVNNLATRLLGNFYMQINRKGREVKLFTNEADAITWLHHKMKF